MRKRFEFFKSNNVSWDQGPIKLQRCTWHSCMMWGWDRLNSGEKLIEWHHYWVLSLKWGSRGVCWHYKPYEPRYRRRGDE